MLIQEIIGAFTGQNRRDRRRQVALGTLAGLTTGALAALLFAPQSGEKTRKEIARRAKDGAALVRDYSVRTGRKIRDTALEVKDSVSDAVEVLKHRGEELVEDAGREARDAARAARRKARDVGEDVAEGVEEAADKVKDKARETKKDLKDADKKD